MMKKRRSDAVRSAETHLHDVVHLLRRVVHHQGEPFQGSGTDRIESFSEWQTKICEELRSAERCLKNAGLPNYLDALSEAKEHFSAVRVEPLNVNLEVPLFGYGGDVAEIFTRARKDWLAKVKPGVETWMNTLAEIERELANERYTISQEELEAMERDEVQTRLQPPAALSESLMTPPPDFGKITSDSRLASILADRWLEVQRCTHAGAHLAAVILCGSILEGSLIAFINARDAEARRSPKWPLTKSGAKKQRLRDLSFSSLIEVAHDRGWIEAEAKGFNHALRKWRNLVHPSAQLEHKIKSNIRADKICWEIVSGAINTLIDHGHP